MINEYYFSKNVNSDTWEHFLAQEQKGNLILQNFYNKIKEYGWKDKFGFNSDGKAIYISEQGKVYKGIWFEVGERRVAVFLDNN